MCIYVLFFFNDTATTEIYTLSLHDALPIFELLEEPHVPLDEQPHVADAVPDHRDALDAHAEREPGVPLRVDAAVLEHLRVHQDRKSTRLNSSHANISYAVFCLKKKKHKIHT